MVTAEWTFKETAFETLSMEVPARIHQAGIRMAQMMEWHGARTMRGRLISMEWAMNVGNRRSPVIQSGRRPSRLRHLGKVRKVHSKA